MKPFRLGIAGTGTEVGKTTLGARLAAGLRAAGYPVLAAKPIETGYLDPEQSDAAKLAEAAGHAFVAPALTSAEPVGPLRADLGPRGPVDVSTLSAWLDQLERQVRPRVTLVETAGGLFTPLTPTATNLDLLRELRVDGWLLVARDRLGALHDCLATVTAARASGCSPLAVVLGARDATTPPHNADDLTTCLALPVHDAERPSSFDALLTSLRELVRAARTG